MKKLNDIMEKLGELKLDTANKFNQNLTQAGFIKKEYSPKISDPVKYKGSREDLDNFLTRLKLKLNRNNDHFDNKK